jgi:hypothetical protein
MASQAFDYFGNLGITIFQTPKNTIIINLG